MATASPSPPKPNRPVRRATNVDPAVAAQRLDLVRRELRRLVVSEETYYAENGTYTDDLARISFTPRNDADVRFLWLARGGWAASGTHPDVPGRDCVVYVGRAHGAPTTLHDVRQGREGAPVCDGPPPRPVPSPAQPQTAAGSPSSPAVASAPTESPATTPDTGSALDMVDPAVQMRVDLRNLVLSQDTYFANQGIYSRRTEPFALQYLWHRGVTISILTATDAGGPPGRPMRRGPGKLRHLARNGDTAAGDRGAEPHARAAWGARLRQLRSPGLGASVGQNDDAATVTERGLTRANFARHYCAT